MVSTWDDLDWIAAEIERLDREADRQGLRAVQLAYRADLTARAAELECRRAS